MNKNLRISNWEANLMDENGKVKKREDRNSATGLIPPGFLATLPPSSRTFFYWCEAIGPAERKWL
jgi:hypothetical protein